MSLSNGWASNKLKRVGQLKQIFRNSISFGYSEGGGEGAGADAKGIAAFLIITVAKYKINQWMNGEDNEEVELYRGVPYGEPNAPGWVNERFELAYRDFAIPLGDSATTEKHNIGNTNGISHRKSVKKVMFFDILSLLICLNLISIKHYS